MMKMTSSAKAARVRVTTLTLVEAALIGSRLVPLAGAMGAKRHRRPDSGTTLNPKRRGVGQPLESIRTQGSTAVPIPLPSSTPPHTARYPAANTRKDVIPPETTRSQKGHKIVDHFSRFRLSRRAAARVAASANPPREDQDVDWSSVRRLYPEWGRVPAGAHRQLKTVWSAFRAALAATGHNQVSLKTRSGREALLKWCKLAHWLVRTTSLSGITHVLGTLKGWTSDVRRWVVEGVREQDRQGGLARYLCGSLRFHITRDEAAAQLSYVGRALPRGTLSVQRKALVKHKKALGEEFRTPKHILREAREFAANWGERFLRSVPLMNCGFSQSACLEVSASKGGTLEATLERTNALQTDPTWSEVVSGLRQSLQASVPSLPDCDRDILARGTALRDRGLEELRESVAKDGFPRASVSVLPERGSKARVVTKSPWALVQLAHPIRAWLLSGLRRDPRTAETLKGDHGGAAQGLVDAPRLADGREFLSADLTAASDLIPLDLLSAVVEGLIEGTGDTLPDWGREVLKLATGPQILDYSTAWGPSGDRTPLPGPDKFISRRGALMGLPTTWSLLSLIQMFWADRAWRLVFPNIAARHEPGDPAMTPATVICGDDLAAWWPKQVSDAYEQTVRLCGGVFSVGKHFRSRAVVVFTELLFRAVKMTVRALSLLVGDEPRAPAIASWEREGRPFLMKRRRPHAKSTECRRRAERGRRPRVPMMTKGIRSHDLSDHRRVVTRLEPFNCVPLKGLLEAEGGGPHADKHHRQPRWVNIGPVSDRIAKMSRNPLAVRRVLRTLYPTYWAWFAKHGFVPTLPRFLGGPGLPPRTGNIDRLALPADLLRRVRTLVYGTKWHLLKSPTCPWTMMGSGDVRRCVAEHAEARLRTCARVARKGRVPFNGKGVLLGGVGVCEDLATRFENEAIVGIYGCRDFSRKSVFKVRPGEVSRAVRKFWKGIQTPKGERYRLRGEERRRGRLLNKTSVRNLETRWIDLTTSRSYHADPVAAQEGFVLSLDRRVKLDLAIKLGQTGRAGDPELPGPSSEASLGATEGGHPATSGPPTATG
nr:MAG: RNA-dependent RNA polymerase [Narnaviridae-like virus 13]